MTTIVDKLNGIFATVKEISDEDPVVGGVLMEGFTLSLNILKELEHNPERDTVDVSEHLAIIARVMGFSLEDLVKHLLAQQMEQVEEVTKEPDADTLSFITSGLDDYERFIAENSAKEDLATLNKLI